jgi:hypothetical protein
MTDKPCPRCTNADEVSELKAEIARLQDLVAKFQRGGVSTLFAEGSVDAVQEL